MISFGNPWFLTGILSVAVPVYLHLYFRRKPVLIEFPSLKLIRLSVQAMVRRMKLRNLLLLLLRILILLWLTFALAKPFWGVGIGSAAGRGDPSAFVVVLDNSLSMGASHRGISLFNTAKSKGLEILDKMGPYDKASIVLLNDPGKVLFSQLSWDKNELKESIRNAALSMSGTNLFSALQSSLKLLSPVKAYKKVIYVITDMTANSWKPLLDSYDLNRIDPKVDLVLIPIGSLQPANLTMADIEVEAPLVLEGRPVPISGTVWNNSSIPQKSKVSVYINGDKKYEEPIELEPEQWKKLRFSCTFPAAGISHVRMSLPGDSLTQDDVRHKAIKVLSAQKILCLLPPPNRRGIASKDDAFLRFALNPLDRRKDATFLVERRSVDEVQSLNPGDYSIIFLLNQKSLPDGFAKKLSQYVFGGGNLFIFLGPLVDPSWYNLHLIDNLGGGYILPARLGKRRGNSVSKAVSYQLTDFDFGHSAFKVFSREGSGDPGRSRFFEYYQVEANSTALVLARMNHGLPAVLEESRGQGRVMLAVFTADRQWTDWPIKPTFLPFLQQAALGMIGKQGLAGDSILPGTPVTMVKKQEGLEKVLLYPPLGEVIELPIQREGKGLINFSTTETNQTGFYQLTFIGNGKKENEAFTVNFPPSEGNLEKIEPAKIPRFIPISAKPGGSETFEEKISTVRDGRNLSSFFLWSLLILLFLETIIANFSIQKPAHT